VLISLWGKGMVIEVHFDGWGGFDAEVLLDELVK